MGNPHVNEELLRFKVCIGSSHRSIIKVRNTVKQANAQLELEVLLVN